MSTALGYRVAPIRLERVACPRCHSQKASPVYSALDYLYGLPGVFYAESCDDCGLWFQNPRPVEAELSLLYPANYGPHSESAPRFVAAPKKMNWLRMCWRTWNNGYLTQRLGYRHRAQKYFSNRRAGADSLNRISAAAGSALSLAARWRAGCDLIPQFVPDGRLLELGCGNGDSLKKLRDLGWRNLHGIELSESAARIARRSGFVVKTATIESALETYPDGWFDAIIAEMVLEHLVNPFNVVRQIARKLKPGGEFLFSTVIRDSVDGRIFGRYGVCYDFPRHMVFFCKRDLNEMLRSDFDGIRSWRQSTPIDFYRPAYLREARFDKQLASFFKSRTGERVVWLLARLNLMGRVSYRCRRKL